MRYKYESYKKGKYSEGTYHRKEWTIPEERRMVAMLKEGKTQVQAAILLGRTVSSVNMKVAELRVRGVI